MPFVSFWVLLRKTHGMEIAGIHAGTAFVLRGALLFIRKVNAAAQF
jgi:hypothetical protein